jgi:HK97 family phage portal protein
MCPVSSLIGSILNKAPVAFTGRGAFSAFPNTRNDPTAQMKAMGANGTLFAIVNRTSNAVSQVDWKLWRKAKSGKPEDRTEVTSHLALDVWERPNPFMTRQEFVEIGQQHLDLTGEGWWVIGRNATLKAIPLELWPVRPDRMAPVPHVTDYLAGYVYTNPDGEKIPLRLDDVIFMRCPNPMDPYRGMGPVQAILTDLDSARYSAEWNRNFFLNSAEPGGIIEVDRRLGDDEFDELTSRWREQHQGVAQAHRVAILEQGKWVDRKFSQRDMQFAELRGVSREVIREAFGFPLPMLGTSQDVNRAAAEAGEYVFAKWLIVARLERWKQALNAEFLPMFGTAAGGLEFDYESPVPADAEADDRARESKANAALAYVTAGYTGDSVVEALDLPDALVWEKPEIPPQLGPGQIPRTHSDPSMSAPVAPGDTRQPQPHHAVQDGHVRPYPDGALSTQDVPGSGARAQATSNQDQQAASTPNDDLQQVQDDWEAALAALLVAWATVTLAQRARIREQIRVAVNGHDVAALAALTVDTDTGTETLTGAMVDMFDTAAGRMVNEAATQGVAVDLPAGENATIAPIATAVSALLSTSLANAAGREALRLYTPESDGSSVAASVDDHLANLSDAYLRDNLGGALTRAQNLGRLAALQGAPTATYYASEHLDNATCPPCRAIDGHRFASLVDATAAYGGGPYVACQGGSRCRGTMIAIWGDGS